MTVPGCAQTTLTALAKLQFGGLEHHLCHTLELGDSLYHYLSRLFQQCCGSYTLPLILSHHKGF